MKEFFLGKKERIYYRKNTFKSNLQTIVFIHGLSGSSSAWHPYEKRLEKSVNILSIDLRGHGRSFRPKRLEDHSIDHFSKDVYKIIKKKDFRPYSY